MYMRYKHILMIRLSDEEYKWVNSTARKNKVSKAHVVRDLIDKEMANEQVQN